MSPASNGLPPPSFPTRRSSDLGHRIYKNYDPRAKIIKRIAEEVFDVTGKNPLIDIALELERIALQEEYFVTRKLRSEEHTSELQSRLHLVCRLLLEKKNIRAIN